MPLTEIEFELPAQQYALMGYPGLKQGEPLSVVLDAGVLLPDPAAVGWFTAQKDLLPARFQRVGRANYAFTGRILAADLSEADDLETATLLVDCGEIPLRVTCAPEEDGRLPFGTWETRTVVGLARIQGIVEDDFAIPIGEPVGVTVWHFRRLLLAPGDPFFGEWHESDTLPPLPFTYDRVLITARLHRSNM